jgi:hypothetical protein
VSTSLLINTCPKLAMPLNSCAYLYTIISFALCVGFECEIPVLPKYHVLLYWGLML